MGKISLNIQDKLEEEIRKFGEKKDLNLTKSCVFLLEKGLREENFVSPEKYSDLLEKNEELYKNYKKVQKELEEERKERIKALEDYKNFNTKLISLMEADRILQIEESKPKQNLLKRIKVFFIGENKNN
ncbi:hypothetical protein FYJ26_10580 [Anaerococcus sp. WCA-380-WT-2B]|uniref:Uncharacterized protein n=1 Tax=Anaerococcus porci TaxID=2652269 RepID=A0A6N7VVD0_9FIRM|nr:hypothetical protein [Anaerococcus porci]MSS78816.1 hypothetical protein [Anaerococcus porci]